MRWTMSQGIYFKIPLFISTFLAGVAFRSFFGVPQNWVLALVGLVAGLMFFVVLVPTRNLQTHVFQFAVFGVVFLLGVLRFSVFENNIAKDELHAHYGEAMVIQGIVVSSKPGANSERLVLETE